MTTSDYPKEEPTRPDILKPEKVDKRKRPMVEQGSAPDGDVGDVSVYSEQAKIAVKEQYAMIAQAHDPDAPMAVGMGGSKLVPGWNRGLKGSQFGASIGGRPTSLTPELEKELFEHLERGTPVALSCRLVGIDQSTLSRWRTKEKDGENPELTRFFIDFTHARAVGELNMVQTALRGDGREYSHGPAKSAQWLLERAFGHAYAPRVNMKVESVAEMTIESVTKVCAGKDCGCYEAILGALQELQEAREHSDE